MANAIPTLSVWTDFSCNAGTRVGIITSWWDAVATVREGADDSFSVNVAASDPMADEMTAGRILRVDSVDGGVEEWSIQTTDNAFPSDVFSVRAVGAVVALAERIVIYTSTGLGSSTVTYTGTPTEILTALQATPEWPSWITTGTIDVTTDVSITCTSANGRVAIASLLDACNAARPVTSDPVVLRFRRNGTTDYKIDLMITLSAGPTILEGQNLTRLTTHKDRGQQYTALAPVGASNVMTAEALFRVRYQTNIGGGQKEVGVEAIDGTATIVLDDDQWNGYYLVDYTGTTFLIIDTQYAAICSKLIVSDAVSVGVGVARFARNSAGDALLVFPKSGAPTPKRVGFHTDTTKTRRINWTFIPAFDQYDSGILRGWTKTVTAGTGVFSQDTTNYETGTMGLKFDVTSTTPAQTATALGGTGGTFDGAFRAGTWVVGFRAYSPAPTNSSNREAQISLVQANGVTQTLTGTNQLYWNGTASGWQDTQVTFAMTGTADTSIAITVYFNLGTQALSTYRAITVDRVWLFRQGIDDLSNTLVGSNLTDLVSNAQRELRATDGDPIATYTVEVADRYRDDYLAYPNDELAPYRTARLVAPTKSVDVTQRIVQVTRVLDHPLKTQIQLGALRRRLSAP